MESLYLSLLTRDTLLFSGDQQVEIGHCLSELPDLASYRTDSNQPGRSGIER